MRSLWRALALQWLGGEGSEALAGSSTVRDMLFCNEPARAMQVFDVRREPGVSHDAMMRRVDGEIDSPEELRSEVAGPLSPLI
jgi:hypothetical protein